MCHVAVHVLARADVNLVVSKGCKRWALGAEGSGMLWRACNDTLKKVGACGMTEPGVKRKHMPRLVQLERRGKANPRGHGCIGRHSTKDSTDNVTTLEQGRNVTF